MHRKMMLILNLCFLIFLHLTSAQVCPDTYEEHPLLLVSMDGFKSEYLERGLTPTIQSLIDTGVRVPYMEASYPTITFPNHYTIATGLYPESHGIIANEFYDPTFNEVFSLGSPESLEGKWWGGEPIWNTVVKQGKKSATFFWPGSDAPIQNMTPTYFYPYDGSIPYDARITQVLDWLALPVEERPSWICLYFDEPDHTGHSYGPDSPTMDAMLAQMDANISSLINGIADLNLTSCVNLIILADHGMATSGANRQIELENYIPFVDGYVYTGAFSRVDIYSDNEDETVAVMESISCQNPDLRQFTPAGLPKRFHFSNNIRIEDVVLDMSAGFYTTYKYTYTSEGNHGYDNFYADMGALFLANGPEFRSGVQVETFQNIELYNLMCHLVGVVPVPNNGTIGSLYHILKSPPTYPSVPQETDPLPAPFPEEDTLTDMLSISGCQGDLVTPEEWLYTLNLTEVEMSLIKEENLPWGIPLSANLTADVTLLYHHDHVTGYSQLIKMPLWTSFTVETGYAGTSDAQWSSDVRLTATSTPDCLSYAYQLPDIIMEPLFPNQYSKDASLDRVPYMVSNAVPMTNELRGRWATLVNNILSGWVNDFSGPLNVVMGPLFDNNADSLVDDYTLFQEYPEIPSDMFMIVTRCINESITSLSECNPVDLDALAFIYPEVRQVTNCLTLEEFALEFSARVRDVELSTGLTFFPSLSYEDRTRIILRIHSNLWPIN